MAFFDTTDILNSKTPEGHTEREMKYPRTNNLVGIQRYRNIQCSSSYSRKTGKVVRVKGDDLFV